MESRSWYLTLLLLALLAGCASKMPQTAAAQSVQARPVDAAEDNRAVLGQLTPGLVMRLEIDGKTVQVHDAELVLIPRRAVSRRSGAETVLVTGWRGQEQVSAVSVPDQRINAQEDVGIVVREQPLADGRLANAASGRPRRGDAPRHDDSPAVFRGSGL